MDKKLVCETCKNKKCTGHCRFTRPIVIERRAA
jgi:hypothetical protein